MTTEMVACIPVESLSILEKMHSRGYADAVIYIFLKEEDISIILLNVMCLEIVSCI